jgi:DNA repair protein RadA/Sms
MPKVSTQFVCQNCGATSGKWAGRCVVCGVWNSLAEAAPELVSRNRTGAKAFQPESLAKVASDPAKRFTSGIAELDQVLGGGVVPGSILLLSGDPGVGKSTLVLQVAAGVAKTTPVLYISGEESIQQIKLRADRLSLGSSDLGVASQTDADAVAQTIREGGYGLVIIDSIQTMATSQLTGSPGTVGQITATAQIISSAAKDSHTAVVIIGHVTKEGAIAGPKILEHLVDVVLYLEGERYGIFKALRGVKNRFGSTNEVGIFEMGSSGLVAVPNPSDALLAERQLSPGSVVFPALEGTRCLATSRGQRWAST